MPEQRLAVEVAIEKPIFPCICGSVLASGKALSDHIWAEHESDIPHAADVKARWAREAEEQAAEVAKWEEEHKSEEAGPNAEAPTPAVS